MNPLSFQDNNMCYSHYGNEVCNRAIPKGREFGRLWFPDSEGCSDSRVKHKNPQNLKTDTRERKRDRCFGSAKKIPPLLVAAAAPYSRVAKVVTVYYDLLKQ